MTRSFYLELAETGKRLPVATHLVLHEQPDPEAILLDGQRLAEVVVDTARRFDNPLALPVMDLTLEKDIALRTLGVAPDDIPKFHFDELPDPESRQQLSEMDVLASPRIKATCDALSIIAKAHAEGAKELPVGMCIGPFSLLTKLLSDPITPIFLAGSGLTAEDDDEVALVYALTELTELIVAKYCQAQIDAGASAIFVCEPAANVVFFSPNQIAGGSTIYQELVIEPNLRLKKLLDDAGVDTAVLSVPEGRLCVLLVRGKSGQYGLPGTFLHPGETLQGAALRALREKASVTGLAPRQLRVFDDPARDDRGWVLSVAHVDAVRADLIQLTTSTLLMPVDECPALAFDHTDIVAHAAAALRAAYREQPDPHHLLPPSVGGVTIRDLRLLHEAVLGQALVADTFRRTMLPHLVPTGELRRGVRGKPAELFRRAATATPEFPVET